MTDGNDSVTPIGSETGHVGQLGGGLTKREYFAAMAMQSYASKWMGCKSEMEECAKRSVEMADALIEALNKNP